MFAKGYFYATVVAFFYDKNRLKTDRPASVLRGTSAAADLYVRSCDVKNRRYTAQVQTWKYRKERSIYGPLPYETLNQPFLVYAQALTSFVAVISVIENNLKVRVKSCFQVCHLPTRLDFLSRINVVLNKIVCIVEGSFVYLSCYT